MKIEPLHNPRCSDEVEEQRQYYARTAHRYDAMHVGPGDEHSFALSILLGAIDFVGASSVLDVGAGTGRALEFLRVRRPDIRAMGVEPVADLRRVAHDKEISPSDLVDGDAQDLAFQNRQFDLVTGFGLLHHVPSPARAVSEMLRVANKAIFISDGNNFGQGSALARLTKQVLDRVGLWPLANRIKTQGRGYTVSEGDGIAYSYSVFSSYEQIADSCRSVHVINTLPAGPNHYRSASHVALLGILT